MLDVLRAVRSFASVLLVGLLFLVMTLPLRLVVVPLAWLVPRWQFLLVTLYMKAICHAITFLLSLGGARFSRRGAVETGAPRYIVANHQSLLDIVQVTLMSRPRVPAFVPRARYARFVPHVSACIRLLGCPVVDPRRDPEGALMAMKRAARDLPHGLLIFPEGHRSTTGDVRPFRAAGLVAVLEERPLPVSVVINDGTWRVRRFADLLFRVHLVNARSETVGPFEPPPAKDEFPAFVEGLRQVIVDRLIELRSEHPPVAAPLNLK
jgi:1-acyl-sn-glycerol-3-phosphate acyltransferase